MLDVVGEDLAVIANTADDVEIYGAHVSPDPDLVLYWLADRIDERGWGLRGDSFAVMEGLRALGADVWFWLGDRDLAVGLHRRRRLDEGARLTEVMAELAAALGVRARVLPMSDDPVRTRVRYRDAWWPFQEYMIRAGARGPVEGVEIDGAGTAKATPEVLEAISTARAIVIGPSNPVISIGPILALAGVRDALRAAPAAVVAVSPIVGGRVQ
jgi:LPPG:FO 2-phospho-L-lactate transferase